MKGPEDLFERIERDLRESGLLPTEPQLYKCDRCGEMKDERSEFEGFAISGKFCPPCYSIAEDDDHWIADEASEDHSEKTR